MLRAVELSDKDILKILINDPETEYLLGGWSFPVSDINQEEWIKAVRQDAYTLRCMIEDKQAKVTVGTVILSDIDYKNGKAEFHIKLLKDFCGKGYGTDAVKTVIRYAFNELRLQCIYAYVNDYNIASQKLFEKAGFNKEGILRNRIYKDGAYHDQIIYSVINDSGIRYTEIRN